MPSFVLGVEICEDLWSALPPSTFHALAGATVIANLSASDETVGKAEYRRALVENQSARLLLRLPVRLCRPRREHARTWCSPATTSSPRTVPSLAETDALCGRTMPRRSWTASGWSRERARNTSFEPSAEGYPTVDFDLALDRDRARPAG